MNIAIIGGLERRELDLAKIAEEAGHRLEWHTGHVGGVGADRIRRVVERSDVVIVVTRVNSHGAMYLTKRIAREAGRKAIIVRSCGTAQFRRWVAGLDSELDDSVGSAPITGEHASVRTPRLARAS